MDKLHAPGTLCENVVHALVDKEGQFHEECSKYWSHVPLFDRLIWIVLFAFHSDATSDVENTGHERDSPGGSLDEAVIPGMQKVITVFGSSGWCRLLHWDNPPDACYGF